MTVMHQTAIQSNRHFGLRKISEVAPSKSQRYLYNGINSMSISPFLSISGSCDEAFRWTSNQFTQSFDLHAARAGLRHCTCPNHGTEDCDCQMIVVPEYGNAKEPVT